MDFLGFERPGAFDLDLSVIAFSLLAGLTGERDRAMPVPALR
jgi:hypothetical protein